MPLNYHFLAQKGAAFTFHFSVETPVSTGSDIFLSAAVPWVAGDVKVSKDGGATANVGTLPTRIGSTPIYEQVLTAAEMTADEVFIYMNDAAGGPLWRDICVVIQTQSYPAARRNIAQAGAAGTITLDAGANATDDYYNEAMITIVGGTGAGQSRMITDYTGASKVATINRNWVTNPDNTSAFIISGGADVWDQLEGAELSAIPSITTWTVRKMLQLIHARFLQKITETSTVMTLYKRDDSTTLTSKTVGDDGTTASHGRFS